MTAIPATPVGGKRISDKNDRAGYPDEADESKPGARGAGKDENT